MKIIYCYDALCGWCYGFSPVMHAFYQKYQEQFSFEVVSGGMITGERIGPIGEVAAYISEAYKVVEATTGVTFGDAFLQGTLRQGTTVFTSIPPAIALSIVKKHHPEQAIPFANALKKAIYYDGIPPSSLEAYAPLAERFNMDGPNFVEKLKQPEYQALAAADFKRARDLRVDGFPCVLVQLDEHYHPLTRGYCSLENLEDKLHSLTKALTSQKY